MISIWSLELFAYSVGVSPLSKNLLNFLSTFFWLDEMQNSVTSSQIVYG